MVIRIGEGTIATELPAGFGYRAAVGADGAHTRPRLTADYVGPPPTSTSFTSIAFAEGKSNFSAEMGADPFQLRTQADGLHLGYTATPNVGELDYSFPYHDDIRIGLAGLNVDGTRLAASTDWTATADWGGEMRATFGQGLPFVYVRRSGDKDAVVDLHSLGNNSKNNPVQPLTYTLSGLTGRYDGGKTAFHLGVDAGAKVANGASVRVSYDFDGDGKFDRVETYDWFGTDAGKGFEDFNSVGRKLLNVRGQMADMKGGSIKVEVWRSHGDADIALATDSARSFIDAPFVGLTTVEGGSTGDKLYLRSGAIAAGKASTLSGALPSLAAVDTTKVPDGDKDKTYSGPGTVWYNKDGVIGVTINGVSYGIFGPTGATWTYTPTGFRSNLDGKDYFSVASLPDESVSTLMDFRSHAYAFVTDTTSSYVVDKAANSLTTTYEVRTQMMESGPGLSSDALIGLRRHQYLTSDAKLGSYSYATTKGEMKLLAGGNGFTTRQQLDQMLPVLPVVADEAQRATLQQMIHGELQAFLAKGAQPFGEKADTYWGARDVVKYADLAMIAQQVGYGEARDVFVAAIKKQLQTWFDATDGDGELFYYDKDWATLIGYPASYGSDTGLADHHFHYGYIVYAAAAVAQFDPAWAAPNRYGGIVDELVKSVANWDRQDPTYAYLATFDPYAGHSWAAGTGHNLNQESFSEALNFAAAAARWGAITGRKEIEDVGLYLHTVESAAAEQYWLDIDNAVFPEDYRPDIAGRVFYNGADDNTWFAVDNAALSRTFARQINWTPINAGTSLFYAEHPDRIRSSLAAASRETGLDGPLTWKLPYWMMQSMVDPEGALKGYAADPKWQSGTGETKAYTLGWLQTMAALGTPDATVTADSPYVSVFRKDGVRSYVAFNPGATASVVTFSDGTRMTVAPGEQRTLRADGSTMSLDFDADVGKRPAGEGFGLLTDPPQYALQVLSSSGDLQLLVEDRTGTLWAKVGAAEPRSLVKNGARITAAVDPNTTIIAIGRGADGRMTLLGRTRNGEPFYPLTLDAELRVGAGGAALYRNDYAKLEPIYGIDVNGDGVILRGTLRTVASNGPLVLLVDEGNGLAYFRNGTGALTAIRRGGAGSEPSALSRGGATLSAIAFDPDGAVRVLDTRPNAGVAYSWKLDAKGNWSGENAVAFSDAGALAQAKAIYQRDLNGDGTVPRPLDRVVAVNGDLKLMVDPSTGFAHVRLENGLRVDVLRGGQPVKLDRGSQLWAIGRDTEGRLRVLDGQPNNPNASQWSWILDAKGNFTGENAFTPATLGNAEGVFGRDLNGDGKVSGVALKLIDRNGDDSLYVDPSTGKALVSIDGGAPMAITRDGWGDVQQMRGEWSLGAIATDANGRIRVMDASPFSDARYAWILDARGHWSGETSYGAATVGQAETLFAKDFDRDGSIGPASSRFAA